MDAPYSDQEPKTREFILKAAIQRMAKRYKVPPILCGTEDSNNKDGSYVFYCMHEKHGSKHSKRFIDGANKSFKSRKVSTSPIFKGHGKYAHGIVFDSNDINKILELDGLHAEGKRAKHGKVIIPILSGNAGRGFSGQENKWDKFVADPEEECLDTTKQDLTKAIKILAGKCETIIDTQPNSGEILGQEDDTWYFYCISSGNEYKKLYEHNTAGNIKGAWHFVQKTNPLVGRADENIFSVDQNDKVVSFTNASIQLILNAVKPKVSGTQVSQTVNPDSDLSLEQLIEYFAYRYDVLLQKQQKQFESTSFPVFDITKTNNQYHFQCRSIKDAESFCTKTNLSDKTRSKRKDPLFSIDPKNNRAVIFAVESERRIRWLYNHHKHKPVIWHLHKPKTWGKNQSSSTESFNPESNGNGHTNSY